jgi:hypothetical protein
MLVISIQFIVNVGMAHFRPTEFSAPIEPHPEEALGRGLGTAASGVSAPRATSQHERLLRVDGGPSRIVWRSAAVGGKATFAPDFCAGEASVCSCRRHCGAFNFAPSGQPLCPARFLPSRFPNLYALEHHRSFVIRRVASGNRKS